jgi:hypothetical protein
MLNLDDWAVKTYSDAEFLQCWPNLKWAHIFGRLAVVKPDEKNRAFRVSYPADGVGPEQTGSQFVMNLPPANEYELSYKVLFEEGFDFCKGGKLPGLTSGGAQFGGGHHPVNGEGWSARLMWREKGAAELYLYYVDNKATWGDSYPFDGVVLTPGKWHSLRQRVTLNSPDGNDGRIQIWVDQRQVLDLKNMRLRIGDQGPIDSLYFSTFHGGNTSDWAPARDSFARFDDFLVVAPHSYGENVNR